MVVPQLEPPCARAAFAACQLATDAAAGCQRRTWTTGRRAVGLRPLRVEARWRRVEAAGLQQRRALGCALAATAFKFERSICGVERALALATSLATPPRAWRSVVVVGISARACNNNTRVRRGTGAQVVGVDVPHTAHIFYHDPAGGGSPLRFSARFSRIASVDGNRRAACASVSPGMTNGWVRVHTSCRLKGGNG